MKITFDEKRLNRIVNAEMVDGRVLGQFNDPQIIFDWGNRFRSGWYRIEMELQGEPGGIPRVYFDMGHGFNEVERVDLVSQGKSGRYRALLKLPDAPRHVRLDPTDTNNPFKIWRFAAHRVSLPVILIRGVWRLTMAAFIQPSRLTPMLGRAWELVRGKTIAGVNVRPIKPQQDPYKAWRDTHDFKPERDTKTYKDALSRLAHRPRISVVMPVYNTDPSLLKAAIDSVKAQLYENWELCIADDASTRPETRAVLEKARLEDPRIQVHFCNENGHISRASNCALTMVTGEWLVPLDHDDVLRPHTLAEVALALSEERSRNLIYSDEDKVSDDGTRFDPHFKPDFSPDLLRSMNYFNHITAFRSEIVKRLGGWREGYEGAQDYDLVLRYLDHVGHRGVHHIPKILYHWRATAGSTAKAIDEKNYAWMAGQRALADHLHRNKVAGEVEAIDGVPFYRIRYSIATPEPRVTLIMPTRDNVDVLNVAVDSIFQKTAYKNFDVVIVDNGSVEPDTRKYFQSIQKGSLPIRILSWDAPFNFSAINNFAVSHAESEIVGLINNDVEVISGGWLSEMVSWAQQPRIGCVGAKLYYPDGSIQHAGVIAGIGGVAGHSHKYYEGGSHGYFGRLRVAQNMSAVTAACLLVRREVYQEVGGLDETSLCVAFNDVDFCFKVMKAGYQNIWTPWAELYHHESKSRGQEDTPEKKARFMTEVREMQARWSETISRDPHYNLNLTLDHEDFSLRL